MFSFTKVDTKFVKMHSTIFGEKIKSKTFKYKFKRSLFA